MASSERKMMLGSERKLDYLVIAESGHYGLGIKSVVLANIDFGVAYGVRLRASFLPSCPQNVKIKGADFSAIWPQFKWEKSSAERASAHIVVPTGLMPWRGDELLARMPACAVTLVNMLEATMAPSQFVNPFEARTFIKEGWAPWMEVLAKAFPAEPKDKPDKPVAHFACDLLGIDASPDAHSPQHVVGNAVDEMKKGFKVIDGGKHDPVDNPEADFAEDPYDDPKGIPSSDPFGKPAKPQFGVVDGGKNKPLKPDGSPVEDEAPTGK